MNNGHESEKITRINLSYAKVLVVDDNYTNLYIVGGFMGLYGIAADSATGGQEAIDIIRDENTIYDAVFMDHLMPGMDGIEATRIIRDEINTDYAKNIPIIALTANANEGNEDMFLSKGFQAFLAKPINLARLDVILRRWVRNKDAEELLEHKTISTVPIQGLIIQADSVDIPGLDVKKGIAHFGFSEDAYFRVLKSFVNNTKLLMDSIKDVNRENLADYAVTVHGIKGSSLGILADKLSGEAEALESAAIGEDLDYVRANNQRFLDMLSQLFSDIENALSGKEPAEKPIKEKLDETLLSDFLKACIDVDIDEMDTIMAEIELYEYTADDGLCIWMRENLDRGRFKALRDKLSGLV